MIRGSTFFLFLCFFSLEVTQSLAQISPKNFGDVDVLDFGLSKLDSSDAIIIFDKGQVIVDPVNVTGTIFKRHIRIKILRKEGTSWGNFEFLVVKNSFVKPKGATYNLEKGVIVKTPLDEKSTIKNRFNKYADNVRITFPNVKEGSIVELSYEERLQGLYLQSWKFQNLIPTLWSEYSIQVPITDFLTHLRGTLKPTRYEEKYDGKFKLWVMTNVPAFEPESLMPDKDVYISSVEFGTYYRTWLDVRNGIYANKNFSGVLLNHGFLNEALNKITVGLTDSLEKIKAISNYVKENVRFNGTADFFSDDPAAVIERKYGSSGDINLLFGSLLSKAGFKVSMVLLSTRDHGFILDDFPSASQFNYVVCQVTMNSKELLLDATEKNLPFNYLPERCFNHKGFLVSDKMFGWIGMEPVQRNKTYINADFALSEKGDINGKLTISKYEYAAYKARSAYDSAEAKNDLGDGRSWDIKKYEILNRKEIEMPVVENVEASLSEYVTTSQDLMYINPHMFLREEFNPFTADKREYPVDFPTLTDNYVVLNITVPDGFTVDDLPPGKVFTLPENAAKFTLSTSVSGNRITVLTRLQINKTLFQPYEYAALKEFYSKLIAKKSENIVLKRK